MTTVNDARPEWVRRLEAKYGLPIQQIPGTLYGLCYDPPIVVRSVSLDYAGDRPSHDERGYLSARAIGHYVGWTQQRDPHRRIADHHPAGTPVTVTLGRGTMEREEQVKRTAICPTCGEPYSTSLTTSAASAPTGFRPVAGDRFPGRTPEEFARARAELDGWVKEITSIPGRDFSDLDGFERYVLGVHYAAVWTMGERATSPLLDKQGPLTEEEIITELAVAEALAKGTSSKWEIATGVRNWLRWVIGEQPQVPYSVRDWL